MCPILGPLVPVLDFWWRLLWVSKPEWFLPYLLFCGGKCNVHSPRSTSGATHANLLVVSIAAGHLPICISRGGTWLGFEQEITRTEDKCATIVPATRLEDLFCPSHLCLKHDQPLHRVFHDENRHNFHQYDTGNSEYDNLEILRSAPL